MERSVAAILLSCRLYRALRWPAVLLIQRCSVSWLFLISRHHQAALHPTVAVAWGSWLGYSGVAIHNSSNLISRSVVFFSYRLCKSIYQKFHVGQRSSFLRKKLGTRLPQSRVIHCQTTLGWLLNTTLHFSSIFCRKFVTPLPYQMSAARRSCHANSIS